MNSRNKGKNGELELARILREYGYNARRGQQYCGANGDADVVGLPGIHIECKRVERLNLREAMEQAFRDALSSEMPAVFRRKNHGSWMVTMMIDDWMELYGNQKQEWIWCRNRLPEEPHGDVKYPEDTEEYAVMIKGTKKPTCLYYAGEGKWFDWLEYKVWYDVAAWMPLPVPPEEEP